MATINRASVINAGRNIPEGDVCGMKSIIPRGSNYALATFATIGLIGGLSLGGYKLLENYSVIDNFKSTSTAPAAVLASPVAVSAPPVAVSAPPAVSAPVAVSAPPVAVSAPPVAVSAPPAVAGYSVASEMIPPTYVPKIPDSYHFEYVSDGESLPSRLEYICDTKKFNVYPQDSPNKWDVFEFLNDPRHNMRVNSLSEIIDKNKIEDVAKLLQIPNKGHYRADFRQFIDDSNYRCH